MRQCLRQKLFFPKPRANGRNNFQTIESLRFTYTANSKRQIHVENFLK